MSGHLVAPRGLYSTILFSTCLAWVAPAHAQEQRTPSAPGVGQPGSPQPGLPAKPGLPALGPTPPVGQPVRPLDPTPINPRGPDRPVVCLPNSGPVAVLLSVAPSTIRDGTPVTLTVGTRCPIPAKTGEAARPVSFPASSPSLDRAAGQTMVAFINQIPRMTFAPGSASKSVTFTPRGLTTSVAVKMRASLDLGDPIVSAPVDLAIVGSGEAPPPPPRTEPPASTCRPTLGMNAIETAVTAGALVNVDLTLSCASAGPVQVQILSTRANLVAPPPGGLVTIPAGQRTMRVRLESSRTEFGTTTVRAALSNPAGNTTAGDDVVVVR